MDKVKVSVVDRGHRSGDKIQAGILYRYETHWPTLTSTDRMNERTEESRLKLT